MPILLIWALSPIGGQAALRMVLEEPSVLVNTSSIEYENMMDAISFTGGPGFLLSTGNAFYSASLLAPAT